MILLNQNKNNICDADFLNKSKENLISKLSEYIKEYENTINFGYIECPNCKCSELISYGTYTRNIGLLDEYLKIKIKRIKCKNCNNTHALIPSFIIPYYQNEVSYIEIILKEKVVNKKSTKTISDETGQGRQIINFWIRRFRVHLTRLRTSISSKIDDIFNNLLNDNIKIRLKYEQETGVRFLSNIPT